MKRMFIVAMKSLMSKSLAFPVVIVISLLPFLPAHAVPPAKVHRLFHTLQSLPESTASYSRVRNVLVRLVEADPARAYRYFRTALFRVIPKDFMPNISSQQQSIPLAYAAEKALAASALSRPLQHKIAKKIIVLANVVVAPY